MAKRRTHHALKLWLKSRWACVPLLAGADVKVLHLKPQRGKMSVHIDRENKCRLSWSLEGE